MSTLSIILVLAILAVIIMVWFNSDVKQQVDKNGSIVDLDQSDKAPYKIEAPMQQEKVEIAEEVKVEVKPEAPVKKKRQYKKKEKAQ